MPSRRRFLRRIGPTAATVSLVATAGCLGGVVRTKVGGGFTDTIDLSSPDDGEFVLPDQFTTYVDRIEDEYGEAAVPWPETGSPAGEFIGAYTRQEDIIPDRRFAVQDAAILVHQLDDTRYRLRLWSAGRLLGKKYEVDPWGYYKENPAFTWLEQAITVEPDDHLSANRSLSTDGGSVDVSSGAVVVPDGSFDMGLENNVRYRSRWENFYAGIVPLIGVCEVSFVNADDQQIKWELSNGVGIRTPF